jgi:hypothetical protein
MPNRLFDLCILKFEIGRLTYLRAFDDAKVQAVEPRLVIDFKEIGINFNVKKKKYAQYPPNHPCFQGYFHIL